MKKILSLLVLLVAFASCEQDIKFNNPAVQGLKDDELWRATTFTATKSGNSVIINANINDFEFLTMRINAPAPNSVHDLGINTLNSADYTFSIDGDEGSYTTGTTGNGEIVIRGEEDNNIDGTGGKGYISGNFYFNAYNADGEVVNFQKGVFYKVPIITVQ